MPSSQIKIGGPIPLCLGHEVDLGPYLQGLDTGRFGYQLSFKVAQLVTADDRFEFEGDRLKLYSQGSTRHTTLTFCSTEDESIYRLIDFALSDDDILSLLTCDGAVEKVIIDKVVIDTF